MGADRFRRVGAVDPVDGIVEIHRVGVEWVAGVAGHVAWQIGLVGDHLWGWSLGWPFRLVGDGLGV